MDHNLDLLKGHEHHRMQQFLDMLAEQELIPTITRPTRIMQSTAMLIDNIFISGALQRSFDSLILFEDISDHLPSLLLMKQMKLQDKKPIHFESRTLTETKLVSIKNELKVQDWNGLLRTDVNENFDKFCQIVSETMDKFAPMKEVKISWRRKYTEPWMTKGIEKALNKCKRLYKDSLWRDVGEEEKKKYKEYRNIYNKLKRTSMKDYYSTKCKEYNKNTKQLWQVITIL